MLLQKAMRYYRLWIYTCNVVLFLGVVIFVITATVVLTDLRSKFVPVPMYHPTFIYAYLALLAQAGLLQAIGCYGALRLNEKWLNVYWLSILFLLVGDILVGVVWIFFFNSITHSLPVSLWARLQDDYGHNPRFTADWDQLQQQMQCCGVHSPRDYNGTRWALLMANGSSFVPSSCCVSIDFEADFNPETKVVYQNANSNRSDSFTTTTSFSSSLSSSNGPYSSSSLEQMSEVSCVQSSSSLQSVERVAVEGCVGAIQNWMQHSADVLFVLGYCVIAFLKLCFLGILRYEIKEMIQKIKVLQSDMPAFPELMSLGLHSPSSQHKNSVTIDNLGHHLNSLTDPSVNHLLLFDKKTSSNGNNNDVELKEMTHT